MKIHLNGAFNARDLGGMVTALGTIKTGRLIRSDELSRLDAEDVQTLANIGLVRIIDLRTDAEQANCPDVEMAGVEHTNNPIIRATTFGITYEKSSGSEIAEMLQLGMLRMQTRGETQTQHMEILYRQFVTDEFCRKGYGRFLKTLANNPVDGATLWHCSAGKDRCGTCAALLLHCLGANREQIFEDYLLTNEQATKRKKDIAEKVKDFVPPQYMELMMKMLSAEAAYLEAFYQQIATDYTTVDNFVASCGVTKADIAALRANYLQ